MILRKVVHYRSSRPELFCKKDVLRNFTKFAGKHLCQRLFFNKVAGLRHRSLAQAFSCEFCEISKNTFYKKHSWWLLLTLDLRITQKMIQKRLPHDFAVGPI